MVHHLPLTKARINLGQVVRRVVRNKEYFILEKDGIPVVGILGARELEEYLAMRDRKARGRGRKGLSEQRGDKHVPVWDLSEEFDGRGRRSGAGHRSRL